ncbi:MAG: hypothetical protein Kow0042_06270 [Calditrichia bacterium]
MYFLLKNRTGIILTLLLFLTSIVTAQPIGGPYTPDANTVLLMHFDGDLSNVSQYSDDGQFHGAMSNFFWLPNPFDPALGQCLRIDNDSQNDSAYVWVPDTSYLDLTGEWTVEGWLNIFTYGTGSGDWRWVPRLCIKTGDEVFWRPNWFVEMWGSWRGFSCGYHTADQLAWPQANTGTNTFQPGEWVHLAFVRDTTRHLLMTIVHDQNRQLIEFAVVDYYDFESPNPVPITTDKPVHIGYAGGGGDSFLDGFVDEIRVSNVVRQFPVPPIITSVTQLGNQPASATSYDVGANIFTLFGTTIQSADLYYSTDGQNFTAVPMTPVMGDSMSASIPQQPFLSMVYYYVKATDNQGLSYWVPYRAEEDSNYFSFAIYQPESQTLALTFEEGSGVPGDTSIYNNTVTMHGTPTFSPDAAVGNYSIYLEGDSSFLEVDSPFLNSDTFCVEFWFKADTIKDYCRILNRPSAENVYWQNNYQIRFNNAQQIQAISDGSVTLTHAPLINVGEWYHIIYEMQMAPPGDSVLYYGVSELRDANDNLLSHVYAGTNNPPLVATAPLRIGKATNDAYPPYFKGNFDNILIYNYPARKLDVVVGIEDQNPDVPLVYELAQNYPNPFNPQTEIRFHLPKTEKVTISIYDVLGRKVRTLVNEVMTPGKHAVPWFGENDYGVKVASGIYFYRMETKNFQKVRKMIFMK